MMPSLIIAATKGKSENLSHLWNKRSQRHSSEKDFTDDCEDGQNA